MIRPRRSLRESFPNWDPKPRFSQKLTTEKRFANSGEKSAVLSVDLYLSLPEAGWPRFAGDVRFLRLFVLGGSSLPHRRFRAPVAKQAAK